MPTILRIQWSPGIICTVVPTVSYPGGVKTDTSTVYTHSSSLIHAYKLILIRPTGKNGSLRI